MTCWATRASTTTNNRQITLDVKANWTKRLHVQLQLGVRRRRAGLPDEGEVPGQLRLRLPGPGHCGDERHRHPVRPRRRARDRERRVLRCRSSSGIKKYLYVTAGARYDYSSAFGKSADGVLYPKFSVSFVPSDLHGFKLPAISSLRLRGAWGQSGRQPSAFAKFTTFAAQTGPAGAGLRPDNLGNPDLKPEVATEIEAGMELGLFNDRFGLDATYWDRKVNDLLFGVQYPPSGGFTNAQLTNVGRLDAHGLELSARGFVIQTAKTLARPPRQHRLPDAECRLVRRLPRAEDGRLLRPNPRLHQGGLRPRRVLRRQGAPGVRQWTDDQVPAARPGPVRLQRRWGAGLRGGRARVPLEAARLHGAVQRQRDHGRGRHQSPTSASRRLTTPARSVAR